MSTDETTRVIPHAPSPTVDDEIDLAELTSTLWAKRKLLAACAGAGLLLSGAVSFAMPNIYTSQVTLMPLDSSSDRLSSMLGSLGALGGLASQAGVGLKATPAEKFVAILNSRTLAENVVNHHKLMPLLFPERWDPTLSRWKPSASLLPFLASAKEETVPSMYDARRMLDDLVKAKANPKTSLIELNVEHTDPKAAATIANAYVLELNAYLQGTSLSTAQRNRSFLQGQVDQVSKQMAELEQAMKRFQEQNKLVSLDAQTQAAVQTYATLKSQLLAKEMELKLQEGSASENDMDVLALQQEIAQLKEKLNGLENGKSEGFISFKEAPSLGLRFAQLKRDLLVKQTVFEMMTQQLELAKVEEAKETLSFQVIDRAIPADRKSKPKRLVNMLVGTMAGLFLGCFAALLLARREEKAGEAPHPA